MNSKLPLTLALILTSSISWAAEHTGTILETMDSGGYTYAKIKENQKEFWVAGTNSVVKVGETISFKEKMKMPSFTSKTLNRTFKDLMFVGAMVQGDKVENTSPVSGTSVHGKITPPIATVSKAVKAIDGYTISDLFSKKNELNGKKVKVRGTVVKVSNEIMKTNWIHIQDGTGAKGSNDIIFRSATATANVGDVIIASGTLVTNKDFGYGYKYDVIVENSSFEISK